MSKWIRIICIYLSITPIYSGIVYLPADLFIDSTPPPSETIGKSLGILVGKYLSYLFNKKE